MAPQEKRDPSVLGLGLPVGQNDPSAWRPSKAARDPEQDSQESKPGATRSEPSFPERSAAWRPSKVNEERLSSLSAARLRKRLAMSPRTRLLFTSVLFLCGVYFFLKVWLMPEAGQLHVALAIAAAAMVLLFISAIIGAVARRRRKRGDDQSILRL